MRLHFLFLFRSDHANLADAVDLLKLGKCLLANLTVDVYHGVSVIALRLVDHVLDVRSVLGECRGDLRDHRGNVGVHDVILCDELGGEQDFKTIQNALKKGVKVVASVHGSNINDINEYKEIFNRFVFLSKRAGVGTVEGIYNGEFEKVIKNIC